MKTNLQSTPLALMALVTIAVGCQGQPQSEPFDGTPSTEAMVVPLDLGLTTSMHMRPTPIMYDLDSRFLLTATKEQLHKAKTIHDLVPGHLKREGVTYTTVSIRSFEGDQETDVVAVGEGDVLDAAQQKLLHSLDYSQSFVLRAKYSDHTGGADAKGWDMATPHVTIVPEHEAVNSIGKEAMIAHVKQGTSAFAYMVDAKALRPGKICFTVNSDGTILDVRLTQSAGHAPLDQRVIDLINTLPGTWTPASNAAGEPVDQEFVFSFGTVGC